MNAFKISTYLLLILTLFSCTPEADYEYSKGTAIIKSEDAGIEGFELVEWKVGIAKKEIIHRGFTLSFELPKLSEKARAQLFDEMKIDSWLIRVRQNDKAIAYAGMQFISQMPGSNSFFRFTKTSRGSIGINYAASSLSTRLDRVPCPVLDHRLFIERAKVVNSKRSVRVSVTSSESSTPPGKVEMISFSPVTVNGGMNLVGVYQIEIALYNSKEKKVMSQFSEISNTLNIEREKRVTVKGCEGYNLPPKTDSDPMKEFKFGK